MIIPCIDQLVGAVGVAKIKKLFAKRLVIDGAYRAVLAKLDFVIRIFNRGRRIGFFGGRI